MLESFFSPKSVAVVGVSADPSKLGAVVFNNLLSAGYEGNLYPVNPKSAGEELYGKKCSNGYAFVWRCGFWQNRGCTKSRI